MNVEEKERLKTNNCSSSGRTKPQGPRAGASVTLFCWFVEFVLLRQVISSTMSPQFDSKLSEDRNHVCLVLWVWSRGTGMLPLENNIHNLKS